MKFVIAFFVLCGICVAQATREHPCWCNQALALIDRDGRAESAGKTSAIDPRVEREPQLVIIAPMFENRSVGANWRDIESIFHVFVVDDLIAVSCDHDHTLHLSIAHDGRQRKPQPDTS
jgi:hypothetical protein